MSVYDYEADPTQQDGKCPMLDCGLPAHTRIIVDEQTFALCDDHAVSTTKTLVAIQSIPARARS